LTSRTAHSLLFAMMCFNAYSVQDYEYLLQYQFAATEPDMGCYAVRPPPGLVPFSESEHVVIEHDIADSDAAKAGVPPGLACPKSLEECSDAGSASTRCDSAELNSSVELPPGTTTVMLRNIPNHMNRSALRAFLDRHGLARAHYRLTVARGCRSGVHAGYAFVQFRTHQQAVRYSSGLDGVSFPETNSTKVLRVTVAHEQKSCRSKGRGKKAGSESTEDDDASWQ